jgi:hypothetical protein
MPDPRVLYLRPEDWPETVLKAEVLKLARRGDWLAHHVTNNTRGRKAGVGGGYPDLTLARSATAGQRARLVLVELKKQRTVLEPDQERWRDVLERVRGVEYHVWRPGDLLNGTIERVLA